jgi:hypothetical protein
LNTGNMMEEKLRSFRLTRSTLSGNEDRLVDPVKGKSCVGRSRHLVEMRFQGSIATVVRRCDLTPNESLRILTTSCLGIQFYVSKKMDSWTPVSYLLNACMDVDGARNGL